MQYYINVTSWNLLESFVTESLSPFAFYQKRNFGNNLSRYLDKANEKTNYLILSTKDQGGDYVIKVDENLLDSSCIFPIRKSKTLFIYSKTIFYKKGGVMFRFSSEDLRDSLVAESQILSEVKCIEKYSSDFFVELVKQVDTKEQSKRNGDNPFSFQQDEFIEQDNVYNKIKGAIVSYVRGASSSVKGDMQILTIKTTDLKNEFAGLNTSIMVNECSVSNTSNFIHLIRECKDLYLRTIKKQTNLFDIIEQQFREIVKLASKRETEISSFYSLDKKKRENSLLREKEDLENKLFSIESETELAKLNEELGLIKAEEKERGKLCGKSRKYYEKGTEKYNRKKFLQFEIKRFEESHEEYRSIKNRIADIRQQLSNLTNVPTTYDAAISALFVRISDIINDVLRNIKSNIEPISEIDYSVLNMSEIPFLNVAIPNCSQAELDFLNVTLREIFLLGNSNISEAYILNLIVAAATAFKSFPAATTKEGQLIISTLQTYWKYKNNKVSGFEIPCSLPVFSSIMAFFVKPFGFDQMERFMQNRDINYKQYGFMLWGCAIGYASLPKTFTNLLYSNDSIYKKMDEYLFSVHKNIELQRPCNQ